MPIDRIDIKLNNDNKTEYLLSANSVELMPSIDEFKGYIMLKTKVNSNFIVGDIVYICALSGDTGVEYTPTTYVMDNVIEISGCTGTTDFAYDWYYHPFIKGYTIIGLDDKKNTIIIDRKYDNKFDNKEILNHYITKIYVDNQEITGGNIDGVVYKNVIMNQPTGDTAIDIDLIQAIILSGTSMKYVDIGGKFDKNYKSLNTALNYSTYMSFNNDTYGYMLIKNQSISGSTINNGYFYDCIISDCIINSGSFVNCQISGGTVNNGSYSGTSISESTTWNYGIWYDGNIFSLETWTNGIWNNGIFAGKTWLNGTFNGGYFTGSTWIDGIFNGGVFTNSSWYGGSFNNSYFSNSIWYGGTFNGDTFVYSDWYDGNFYSGTFTTSTWYNGTFYNGTFESNSNWLTGIFNNGTMKNSLWKDGIFYNGTMENCIWSGGTFNNGIMLGSNWYDGIFNNGIFNGLNSGLTYKWVYHFQNSFPSTWYTGTFNGGELTNAYWIDGNFNNGVVNNSIMIGVEWKDGVFNGNVIGPLNYNIGTSNHYITWSGGTFNNGYFGIQPSHLFSIGGILYTTWLGGDFYNGIYN